MATISDNLNYAYGVAPSGTNWTQDNGTWTGNYSGTGIGQTTAALTTYHFLRWTGSALATNDYSVTTVCSSFDVSASVGAAARVQSATRSGYVAISVGGFNGKLYKVASGTATELADLGSTGVDTVYTIELRVVGTTISVYLNTVLKASVTDSTYASGAPGLCSYGGNSDFGGNFDSFTATDLGSSGASTVRGPNLRIPLAILAR